MKYSKPKLSLLALIGGAMMTGCTTTINMEVMKPADITIPEHLKKIVIADRTFPEKDNKVVNVLEGLFTGEGLFSDRMGAEECLQGLRQSMTSTDRFSAIIPGGLDLRGTGTAKMPDPLPWDTVVKICDQNQADGLIVLEAFDSDCSVFFKTKSTTSKDGQGKEVVVNEVAGNMDIDVVTGWRFYDAQKRIIADSYEWTDHQGYTGQGPSEKEAVKKLPGKRDAIMRTGTHAGNSYGVRISPQWVNVTRMYFTSGNDQFKKAARLARVKDWNGAAEIWKKEAYGADKKLAGRACYNMALASEVNGNLDAAAEWANKSYKEHGNKKAPAYIAILYHRIEDQKRLDRQMK